MPLDPPGAGLRYRVALLGAVIWTALILGLFYWVHKPFAPAQARAWGGALLDLGTALLWIAAAGSLGTALLRRLAVAGWSTAERVAGAGLIGLGMLSLLVLLVGSVWLHRGSMAALLIGVGGLTWRSGAAWLRDVWSLLRAARFRDRWGGFLAGAVLLLVGIALLLALLPPAMWDVLTYHLTGPQAYVRRGHFYAVPHNHFLGFPQLVETLYAGQIALTGRLTSAAPLHWAAGVLLLLMVGGTSARAAGRAAGWVAAALLLVGTTIWYEMTFAYVDLVPMGLAAVALALAEVWERRREDRRRLALLGVLAGFALGTKYTAFWLGAAWGLWVLWRSRRDGPGALLRRALIFGGAALLVALPWLVRGAIWYGSPVYPLFFPAGEMDTLHQSWYSVPGSGLIHSADAWQLPVLPLTATIFGVEGVGTYASDIGPLFLVLLPLLFLVWDRLSDAERALIGRALFPAAIITLGWMGLAAFGSYINLQTRLVLYVFPLLAVAAAVTLEALRRLPDKPLNLGFVMRAIVALVIVLALVDRTHNLLTSGFSTYFGAKAGYEQEYLTQRLGWHAEALRQVNALPAGSRVRFLWEPRTLYCEDRRITCRPDSLLDSWYHARRTVDAGDPAAIAARWRADGAPDYLLVYEFGRQYERDTNSLYTPADWAAWDQFVHEALDEVWRGGNGPDEIQYILYRWKDVP